MAPMGDDEAKKRILARRATFVAAALTTIASGHACAGESRQCLSPPCLSPHPCLSVQPQPIEDAAALDDAQQPIEPEPEGDYAKPPPGEIAAPPGEVAQSTFPLIVTFISIGQGTDNKAEAELDAFIQRYQKARNTEVPVVRNDWGKEGEEDWCFALADLGPAERKKFIADVRRVVGGKKLVQVAENATCRKSKNR